MALAVIATMHGRLSCNQRPGGAAVVVLVARARRPTCPPRATVESPAGVVPAQRPISLPAARALLRTMPAAAATVNVVSQGLLARQSPAGTDQGDGLGSSLARERRLWSVA